MINLLPANYKKQIVYARKNTLLRRWFIVCGLGVLGVVGIIVAGQVIMARSTESWQNQVNNTSAQLEVQKLEETQKRVTEISDSVKLATQVLSKQVQFSKLLTQIGGAMPSGASLQSLSIATPEGGIDLTAAATSYQTATQVQINLSDPRNKIFEKADIVNVACQVTAVNADYPCTVSIRALFAKDNGFQFVTNSKASN